MRLPRTPWLRIVLAVLFFATAFVVAMALSGLTSIPWSDLHAVVNAALLFAVLGALYGAIVVLDERSGMSVVDRPLARTVLCSMLGCAAVALVQSWPPQSFNYPWLIGGAASGGVLGWLGWTWARFVDF